jgi:hypothetical protein
MNNEGKVDDPTDSTWGQDEENFRYMSLSVGGQDPGAFDLAPVYRSLGDLKDSTRSLGVFEEARFGQYSDFMGGGHKTLDQGWFSSPSAFQSFKSNEAPVGAKVIGSLSSPESEQDEPPRVPSYIEPNYHFESTSNPTKLFSVIGEALQAADVHFTVKVFKYKYKCVCYRDGGSIPFDVRIFSVASTSEKKYAVEFQRRKGDVIQFAAVYRELKDVLAVKGHVAEFPRPLSRSTFDLDLSDFPEEEPTPEEYEETVSCLVAMFKSHCVDIQSQAIQALAQLTKGIEVAKRAVFKCGWSVLVSGLASSVDDIHRCAVSGIANLLQDNRDVGECIEKTQGLVAAIVALVSSEVLQVARESARALANLGKQIGPAATDEFKQHVRNFPQVQDTLTSTYLLDLQSAVGVV